MQERISDEWKTELRQRADIVSIVSEYVALKPRGRDLWGLCPFHGEKTASFKVTPEMGLYHCFGCKAGGDVIRFVMDMERMNYMEALRYLSDRVNLPMPQMSQQDIDAARERRSQRERIAEINRRAARFFHDTLYSDEGASVLSYLHARGLDDPAIRMFGLGAAPPSWDALYKALTAEGIALADLVSAGLVLDKEGRRPIDMFRDRAMFPIIQEHGTVLGFGARAMGDASPKYLNTQDTPLFNKRENVYAANLLKRERQLARIILVEGYMDVVSLVHHGVRGVVATLGTALTREQATYLARKAPETLIAYDGDSAGQKAILRALDVFAELGKPARVLSFPGGMDPDDFIRKEGRAAFDALAPLPAPVYRMQCAKQGLDLSTEDGRTEYAMRAAAILSAVRQPVELENLLRRLSMETGFSREVLLQQIGVTPPQQAALPAAPKQDKRKAPADKILPAHIRAERTLLTLMAQGHVKEGTVSVDRFLDPSHKMIAQGLLLGTDPAALMENFGEEMRPICSEVFSGEVRYVDEELTEVIMQCLETMEESRIKQRIAVLYERLVSTAGSQEKIAILEEIKTLNTEQGRLMPGRKE